ncbi:hypothetical protein D3C86_944650 [compost metagenome]
MRLVNQLFEGGHIAKMLVKLAKVFGPISMVTILFGAKVGPFVEVNVVYNRGNPQGIDAQLLDIIQVINHAAEVSTVISLRMSLIHVVIVRQITVFEAVCQCKVDAGLIPVKIKLVARVRSGLHFDRRTAFVSITILIHKGDWNCLHSSSHGVLHRNGLLHQRRIQLHLARTAKRGQIQSTFTIAHTCKG